jgi:alpha-N-acetylglucosamine transferase
MNRDYVNLLSMCLKSLDKFGNKPDNADVIVFTSEELTPDVETAICKLSFPVRIHMIKDITTVRDGLGERLKIFENINCFQYERILYLDSDILVGNSIATLFTPQLKNDTVYAMKEGTLDRRAF